jgi:transposase-like protein
MNNMRSVQEKEKIIKYYLSGHGLSETKKKYNIEHDMVFYRWLRKYQAEGINGLISKTGKRSSKSIHKGLHLRKPKNKIEELELELMKKDIEIARLKKGYNVKGVGQKKEFVTTFNKNTK